MNKVIVAATHNKGKLLELVRILAPFGIEIETPDSQLLESIVEDGETFSENALIKARTIFKATGKPTLADDSGLCVAALGGRPGVYSARYMGEETPYSEKLAGLLKELENVPTTLRAASFVCAVALVTSEGEHVFLGSCDGTIGYAPKGLEGFGYDPIFMVGEKSYAELTHSEKDSISHRGRALGKLINEIDNIRIK